MKFYTISKKLITSDITSQTGFELKKKYFSYEALKNFKLFDRRNWFVKCCIHQARDMGYDTLSFSIFSIDEIVSRKKNMRALQAVKS